jgi:hypothetical protein
MSASSCEKMSVSGHSEKSALELGRSARRVGANVPISRLRSDAPCFLRGFPVLSISKFFWARD